MALSRRDLFRRASSHKIVTAIARLALPAAALLAGRDRPDGEIGMEEAAALLRKSPRRLIDIPAGDLPDRTDS